MPERMLTPGPTAVPPEVQQALARPIIHHRTPEFRETFSEVCKLTQQLFCTQHPILTITGSGTAGMEGAIVSAARPERKVLVARYGKFSERWSLVSKNAGLKTVTLDTEWGQMVTPAQIADALENDPAIGTVVVTHSESSTGAVCDLEAIADVVHSSDVLLLADCITSVGAIPMKFDDWGVDIAVVGSQKALMLPPGLAFAAVSPKAWEVIDSFSSGAYYLNYKAYRDSLNKGGDTPYTPAIGLIMAAQAALRMIFARGPIEATWQKTRRLAAATRSAAGALGLSLLANLPGDSITAICAPPGVDAEALRKQLLAGHQIRLAGGQNQLKGKIFRISHLGYVSDEDMIETIKALEAVLPQFSHTFEAGKASSQIQEALR